jgi:hypothetical protein
LTARTGEGTYGDGVGVVTPQAHKLSQNGPIVKDSTGAPRSGVFYAGNASLVAGKANMSYDVAAFEAAISRSRTNGTSFPTNDAVVNVATTAAPGSNSRIDIIYIQQQEYSEGDASTQAVIAVAQGNAAAVPTAPTIPAGSIELARATIPAGITATTSATITQTARFTAAAGGIVVHRNTTERDAWTPNPGQGIYLLDTETLQIRSSTGWDEFPPVDVGTMVALTGFTIQSATRIDKQGSLVTVVLDIIQNVGNFVTNTPIATVPVGFRPASTVSIACTFANVTNGWLRITSAGEVRIFFTGTASNTVYAAVSYRAA